MANRVSNQGESVTSGARSRRVERLANRLEQGAAALRSLANGLSDAEWQTRIPTTGGPSAWSFITSQPCIHSRFSWLRSWRKAIR